MRLLISMVTKPKRTNTVGAGSVVLHYLLPAWILLYYLVPNTAWQTFSASSIVIGTAERYRLDNLPGAVLSLGGLVLATVTFLFLHRVRSAGSVEEKRERGFGALLFVLTGGYLFAFFATGFLNVAPVVVQSCLKVSVACCLGLLAATAAGRIRNICRVVVVLTTVQAIYCLYLHHQGSTGTIPQATGTFGDFQTLCTLMVVVLPLTIGLAIQASRPTISAVWLLAASTQFAALALAHSPVSLFALGIGLTVMAMQFFNRHWSVLVVGVLLTFLCSFGQFTIIHSGSKANDTSIALQETYARWTQDFHIFTNNWLAGVGVGVLENPLSQIRSLEDTTPTVLLVPGSVSLLWLEEFGIGGGVFFVLFFLTVFRLLRFSRSTLTVVGVMGAWTALTVAGCIGLPFGVASRSTENVLFGMLVGAVLLPVEKEQEKLQSWIEEVQ